MNYIELNNLNNSIIGHYFSKKENKIEANVFSYSLNKDKYVKLPSFRFQVLVISGRPVIIPFEKKMNGNFIVNNLLTNVFKKDVPIYISLYSNKNNCGPILLQQQSTHKLK